MLKNFKINNFDLLRLLAAIQVVFTHSALHLGSPTGLIDKIVSQFPGVPIFFFISGFLISKSAENSSSWKNYFRNRVLRIYPGMWGCLLFAVVTAAIFGGVNFVNMQAGMWLPLQMIGVIYTPGILKDYGIGSYNGSLWTIPVELQFYLVLPVIYFLAKKGLLKKYLLPALAVLFVVITYYLKSHIMLHQMGSETKIEKLLRYSFIPHVWMFLMGATFQKVNLWRNKFVNGKGFYWLAGFLVVNVFLPQTPFFYILKFMVLGIAVISAAYTYPTVSEKLFKGNDISYGVYIYHGVILNAFVHFGFVGSPVYAALLLMTTLFFASLSWVFIEKPFIRRKKSTIHKIAEEYNLATVKY